MRIKRNPNWIASAFSIVLKTKQQQQELSFQVNFFIVLRATADQSIYTHVYSILIIESTVYIY